MNRNKINYWIDIVLVVAGLVVVLTSIIIFFFLPAGVKQSGYQEFLGIAKRDYSEIHQWAGIVMVIGVIIHFILHWDWLICMTKNIFKKSD